jgi:hypothetical protein
MPRDISTIGYDGSSIIGRDRGSPVIPFTDLEHCAVIIVCGRPRRNRVHETSPGKRRLAGLPAHGGSPQAAGWVSGQIGSSPHKPQPEWSRRPTQTPLRRTRPMRLRSRTYRPTTRRANHLHSRSDSAFGRPGAMSRTAGPTSPAHDTRGLNPVPINAHIPLAAGTHRRPRSWPVRRRRRVETSPGWLGAVTMFAIAVPTTRNSVCTWVLNLSVETILLASHNGPAGPRTGRNRFLGTHQDFPAGTDTCALIMEARGQGCCVVGGGKAVSIHGCRRPDHLDTGPAGKRGQRHIHAEAGQFSS